MVITIWGITVKQGILLRGDALGKILTRIVCAFSTNRLNLIVIIILVAIVSIMVKQGIAL